MNLKLQQTPYVYLIADYQQFHGQFPLYQGQNTIGRNKAKNSVALAIQSVSDCHCKIIIDKQKMLVVDLGSKNGVYINEFENEIKKNDVIQINPKNDKLMISEVICKFEFRKNQHQKNFKNKQQKSKQGKQSKKSEDIKKVDFNIVNTIYDDQERSSQKISKYKNKKSSKILHGYLSQQKKGQQNNAKNIKTDLNKNKNETKKSNQQQKKKQLQKQKKNQQIKTLKRKEKIEKVQQKKISKQKETIEKAQQKKCLDKQNNKKQNVVQKQQTQDKKKNIKTEAIGIKNKEQNQMSNQKKKKSNENKKQNIQQKDNLEKKQINKSKKDEIDKLSNKQKKIIQSQQETEVYKRQNYLKKPLNIVNKKNKMRILCSMCQIDFKTNLKLIIVTDPKQPYDFLIMPAYQRTIKFLYSICKGIPIINIQWLIDSNKNNQLLSYEEYQIQVPNMNGLITQSIQLVLDGFKVFNNCKFVFIFQEKDYHVSFKELTLLIYATGGQKLQKFQIKGSLKENLYLIVPNEYDKSQIQDYLQEGYNIYPVEFILSACLYQAQNHKLKIKMKK